MNPSLTGAAAAEHQRDMLVRAAAARRARLLKDSAPPRNPRRRDVRRTHHIGHLPTLRAWLAAGQL